MKGGNALESENELVKQFDTAVQLVKSLPQSSSLSPSYAEAAKIYSYFKQAKFGPCSIPRPGFWDYVNRAKWDAWSALGDMGVDDAMRKYVEEIKNVYHRIKNIEEFEETHLDFADALIPFCQITGADLTPQLVNIVKERQSKLIAPVLVNGSPFKEVSPRVDENVICNGDTVVNRRSDVNSHSSEDDDSHDMNRDALKTTKTVKFDVNGNKAAVNGNSDVSNGVSENDENVNCNESNAESNGSKSYSSYEKEDGELTTSEGDSDEGEIYCDSLSPDQLTKGGGECIAEVDVEASENCTPVPQVIVHEELISSVDDVETESAIEPQLFSLVSSTPFQDTTSQNILRKSEENSCSSNEYEVVDMVKSDKSDNVPTMASAGLSVVCNAERTLPSKKRPNKNSRIGSCKLPEKHGGSDTVCNRCICGARTHKKDSSGHQSHAGGGASGHNKSSNGGTSRSRNTEENSNRSTTRGSPNRSQNGSGMYQRSYDGSSNGNSDDSCSSLSSSSSDNVGLKIVKALERMDDNMHHILDRLDSIDNSMKKLAEQPPPPWWFRYFPSRSVVLSTLWPFVVQLLVYYFWRRRRRRQLRLSSKKCETSLIAANFQT